MVANPRNTSEDSPMKFLTLWVTACLLFAFTLPAFAQNTVPKAPNPQLIAERFAPEFHQGLGDHPRFDYITNFDFDGNWRGDDNWAHADDQKFPLKAYVYYSVIETKTHYFLHYAAF